MSTSMAAMLVAQHMPTAQMLYRRDGGLRPCVMVYGPDATVSAALAPCQGLDVAETIASLVALLAPTMAATHVVTIAEAWTNPAPIEPVARGELAAAAEAGAPMDTAVVVAAYDLRHPEEHDVRIAVDRDGGFHESVPVGETMAHQRAMIEMAGRFAEEIGDVPGLTPESVLEFAQATGLTVEGMVEHGPRA